MPTPTDVFMDLASPFRTSPVVLGYSGVFWDDHRLVVILTAILILILLLWLLGRVIGSSGSYQRSYRAADPSPPPSHRSPDSAAPTPTASDAAWRATAYYVPDPPARPTPPPVDCAPPNILPVEDWPQSSPRADVCDDVCRRTQPLTQLRQSNHISRS